MLIKKIISAIVLKSGTIFLLLIFAIQFFSSAQTERSKLVVKEEFIFEKAPFLNCHASTIAETPEGLVAAWFGGTHEKHDDVEIWMSSFAGNKWTSPISVANGIQSVEKRYPCWNPVLFQYPGGPLLLFYKVGPNPIEWWGELITSPDHGKTWSKPARLPEGILGPVKNKPVLMPDGRLICPSSTENTDGRWQVHLEITRDTGRTWTSPSPLNDGIKYRIIQPSLLTHPGNKLQLLCRSMENRVVSIWSDDGGSTWSEPDSIILPNPNSGTDAVTLQNGRQLLVYNHTERTEGKWGGSRSPLNVAISHDGIQWKQLLELETEPGEFSYPAVIQAKDGTVHITYTWKREKIKYVALKFDEADFKLR